MQSNQLKRNLSYLYLSSVPVFAIVLGLGVGYVSYKIYLPVWLVNVVLMTISVWVIGARVIKTPNQDKKL